MKLCGGRELDAGHRIAREALAEQEDQRQADRQGEAGDDKPYRRRRAVKARPPQSQRQRAPILLIVDRGRSLDPGQDRISDVLFDDDFGCSFGAARARRALGKAPLHIDDLFQAPHAHDGQGDNRREDRHQDRNL
jgi:hypothetical protein